MMQRYVYDYYLSSGYKFVSGIHEGKKLKKMAYIDENIFNKF